MRAFIYSISAMPSSNSDEAVLSVFHILNQFDIPMGICRRPDTDSGEIQCEYTLWSSVTDLNRCRYYIRTYDDSSIRMVDLKELDPSGEDVLLFSLSSQEEIDDITGSFEVLSIN